MTIKERATEWCKHYIGKSRQAVAYCSYEMGACTQRKVDIDKACEWLTERLQFGCHPCNGNGLVEEFRKAMEE